MDTSDKINQRCMVIAQRVCWIDVLFLILNHYLCVLLYLFLGTKDSTKRADKRKAASIRGYKLMQQGLQALWMDTVEML